ncbi:ribosome small subunit-dependent GTPase A [Candidatus Cyanaurora vandensis]|uniref:ribosome small subunit-dependent GTPase A n=1 Tax=Candidatus Cyanaurora vandensis TaxID=2714958 RepID=UPI00257B44D5|nr:ribosome small subunit-dependent GTPase A [Candidatus Cyanaurora vandensis]
MTTGIVIAIQSNYYRVQVAGEDQPRLCKLRSLLKKLHGQVLVGDQVELSEQAESGDQGAITAVLPRTNALTRPAIANVEQVILVLAATQPAFDPEVASRFLVQIEQEDLPVVVVLNKVDLLPDPELHLITHQLKSWGYPPQLLSTRTQAGLEALRATLAHRTSVLAGPSGAGKSSLLNALQPGLALRVGEVSQRLGHGRHTTRHVEIFTLPPEVRLADTPGFSQLTLRVSPEDLAGLFPEFCEYLGHCQFRNCLHREEPGCAVQGAELARHPIYLTFLAEILAQPLSLPTDNTLKTQSRPHNTQTQLPKLARIHRQPSRRSDKQTLAAEWEDRES